MRTIETSTGAKVSLFSSATDIPAKRYNVFNKHLLYDSGIGSDMDAISAHCAKLHEFLASDKKEYAMMEAENLHYSFFAVLNNADFNTLSFACLVHSIDGVECSDLTEDGLNRTKEILYDTGITVGQVEEYINDFKKKVRDELSSWFPRLFPDEGDLPFYEKVAQRIDLVAQRIQSPSEELDRRIADIDDWFIEQKKPDIFRSGHGDNEIDKMVRNFASLCAGIEESGTQRPGEITVYELYGKLDYVNRKNKPPAV